MKVVYRYIDAIIPLILLLWATSTANADDIDSQSDPVATVNGSVISRQAYDREITQTRKQILRKGRQVSESELLAIENTILKDMIDRELLYQESRKARILVKTAEVEKEFVAMRNHYPDEAAFAGVLREMDYTEESFRQQIEKSMARQRLIDRNILPDVSIGENEAKAFYEKHIEYCTKPEKVRARHILIQIHATDGDIQQAKALKKIRMIQQKIASGEDFAALAKTYSECPSAKDGGDLGYFARGQMVKPFEDAAFSLNPGQVSPIVKSEFGYHIIKVIGKVPASVYPFNDIKDQLIEALQRQQVQKDIKRYLERMRATADVRYYLP